MLVKLNVPIKLMYGVNLIRVDRPVAFRICQKHSHLYQMEITFLERLLKFITLFVQVFNTLYNFIGIINRQPIR